MMPNLRDRHRAGYDRLVVTTPECADASLKTWAACDVAAEVLEAPSAPAATMAFLIHWEQTAFGEADRARKTAADRRDALGSIVQGSVVGDALDATARIALPGLRTAYESSGDAYSAKMIANLDLITRQGLASYAALESFRAGHVEALASSGPPKRAPSAGP